MKAVIIGAGIMGLSAAYYLQQSGWEISILEKGDLENNCSYGNAGMIVPSHFVPLASPGIIAQGIRWMLNSKSPFYIRPSFNPDLLKWGLRFIRSANQKQADAAGPFLCALNLYSRQLYEELAAQPGFDFALEKKGIMMYYKTKKAEAEELHLRETAVKLGLDVRMLSRPEAQLQEPAVELDVLGAVHYRCDAHLYPKKLMQQLRQSLQNGGALFMPHHAVTGMQTGKGRIEKVLTRQGDFEGDLVVITGGAWLPFLSRMAGVHIPLMPGKGYSVTQFLPGKKLEIPAILCEAKVAITPMNGYMRYGGTMEIAPVNNRINLNRVKGILDSIPRYFPNLKVPLPPMEDIWYGFRPCSPDGLPYLGRSKKWKNLVFSGGHAMSGLSLGPASGKIVADLANEKTIPFPIAVFDPERFS
ncbi:MAG: NAD(P)/FAD-dependent oxidoreductase [Chitinophagales bacterium]